MGLTPLCKVAFSFYRTPMLISCSFVVDSVDVSDSSIASDSISDVLQHDKFNTARFELHQLLGQPALTGVPLLVVCFAFLMHIAFRPMISIPVGQ